MTYRKTVILAVAVALVMLAALPALAEEPIPEPNSHNEALLELIPELGALPGPDWLITGYRFFYDVLYYDKDDNVTDTATLVFDIAGIGGGHVLTNCYMADFDDNGVLTDFSQYSFMVDYPGLGEVWISPEIFKGEDAPGIKSGVFELVEMEEADEVEKATEAWYTQIDSPDGMSVTELYYGKEDGLLLLLEGYSYDEAGNYEGGSTVKFHKYEEYTAPWMDYGLTGLEEGISILYDMDVTWEDGSDASGVMTFVADQNFSSWAYMIQYLDSEELGSSEGDRIISEMSTDGLMLWMPTEAFKYIDDGDIYFEEEEVGTIVKAGGIIEVAGFGATRLLHFKDGFFMADAYFSLEDGYMVKYYQYPTDQKPFEILLTLKEIK